MKIFIDPGHGGSDPGAVNGNYYEKKINLSIALKLDSLLNKFGYDVMLSRHEDIYVTLENRVALANNWNADLFISIHANSSSNSNATGFETLVYEHNVYANAIHSEIVKITKTVDRGIKIRHDLYVLKHTKMIALLLETGFISNQNDCNKLNSYYYQSNIVNAIANSINSLKGDVTVFTNVNNAIQHLYNMGVISSPDYWINAVKCVKYLDELLLNMANKIQ